jgi:Flp pilus assembly protein TadG
MSTNISRVVSRLRAFAAAHGGNVAMIYALSMIPILAATGSAIDLSRGMVVKMRLGEALDSAALAVGGTLGLTQSQMTTKAQQFLTANYPGNALGQISNLSVSSSGQVVTVSATATVQTAFMGLFGVNYLTVSESAEVTRDSKGLEVALVLDNTGSMAQSGKLSALKSAANTLIDTVWAGQTTPAYAKGAIVPFSFTVRVDTTTFVNNHWVDTTGLSSMAKVNFSNSKYAFAIWATMSNQSWGGCLEARPNGYEELDTAPTTGTPDTLWVPFFQPDEPDSSSFSGYNHNYLSDGSTSTSADTRLKRYQKYAGQNNSGPNTGCNMLQIQPLTNNSTTLKTAINAMIATGNTDVNLGVGWGWRTLSPTPPYTEGSPYGDPYWNKAMVVLTDGTNTEPTTSTFHQSDYTAFNYLVRNNLLGSGATHNTANAEAELDRRTALVCENAKAAGIRVYTILLMENSSRAVNLMRACATSPDLYFNSPSASELQGVFNAIATDLSNLRVSR